MTREEMQRYLIQQANSGVSEFDAYRKLMEILGIEYPRSGSAGVAYGEE